MSFTPAEMDSLQNVLSAPRFATYLQEKSGDKSAALELYLWNLRLSAAFFVPLQICEVSVRNAIASSIEKTYGQNWPWQQSFHISLKNPLKGYNPRRNLVSLCGLPTCGKIVAELNFVFWEKMLTHGHDGAIWNHHFRTAFPYADSQRTVQELRAEGNQDMFAIRGLRNRIAHHEPIFRRDLMLEYNRIRTLISWIDPTAASWMDKIQTVQVLIAERP